MRTRRSPPLEAVASRTRPSLPPPSVVTHADPGLLLLGSSVPHVTLYMTSSKLSERQKRCQVLVEGGTPKASALTVPDTADT